MTIKYNREEIRNKIYGCWIGKNIGGTMGAPFEGDPEMHDIAGFTTPKGEPLPNDDLDLQLVWLNAVETVGPKALNANALSDYWLSCNAGHWNEYGISKSNLELGLLPPLCGEFENRWKNSNGAWIRSEIWACLAPGVPYAAVKYAIMDASIDHGMAEGTYAEIFTAALESMAFFESDIRTVVEKGLAFIPKDCRVASSVRTVLKAYDAGRTWQEARSFVVKDSEDLGWFQAPVNIGFMVIGLIYGEGDFKKSLIYTVNCGDDTDCTAATCGAILGIIAGADGIPQELKEFIGDRITTISINGTYVIDMPKTCTELTERVMNQIPSFLAANNIIAEYTNGETELDADVTFRLMEDVTEKAFSKGAYSFEIPSLLHTSALVEYETEPRIKPNSEFKVKVTLTNQRKDKHHFVPTVYLPEGWTADYNKIMTTIPQPFNMHAKSVFEMTIHVGDKVDAINKIPLMFNAHNHAVPVMIQLVLLG